MVNESKKDIETDFRELALKYFNALKNNGDGSLVKRCKKVLRGRYGIYDDAQLKRKWKYGIFTKKKAKNSDVPVNYADMFELINSGIFPHYNQTYY